MPTEFDIRVCRGNPNSPLCICFRDLLLEHISSLPQFEAQKEPAAGDKANPRPMDLPVGSIFIYAERISDALPIGSACLIPLKHGTSQFHGLPQDQQIIGEVKRTIVLPSYRRCGVAARLLEDLEMIATEEMRMKVLVVETLSTLKTAQALYERSGYERRSVWGAYEDAESCCYQKWLSKNPET